MTRSFVRISAVFGFAGALLSCDHDARVFIPPPADPLFRSYVAIGNSITAGYQAGGMNSATQAQSYAVLLSRQMRTRFAIPALALPGCAPPIVDWRTDARLGGTAAPPCALRDPASATDILNSVAVPDAGTTEINAQGTSAAAPPYHNILTQLILGGKTQVQRALEARPTFATVWIGNNDVLAAASLGIVPTPPGFRGLTSQTTFTQNYDQMIANLLAGAPDVKGVLIGVAQVSSAPRFFLASAFQDATFRTQLATAAGGAITAHPNCFTEPGQSTLVSWEIVRAMRTGQHPRLVVCEKNTPGVPAPVGDIFILDATEIATLQSAITAFNTYIQQKANSIGFAYYDPNPTLAGERRVGGCASVIPNAGAAAAASPFGTCFTNDGVHPSAAGQILIANALIPVINAKYGTTLAPVP